MATVLVSILSEHSIPNYLFLKEWKGKFHSQLFVTTERVEQSLKSGMHIEKSLRKEEGSVPRIIVDSDDYQKILVALREAGLKETDTYLVNLTGGTKAMSLAVHHFFANMQAQFFYVPIGKNAYYDFQTGETMPINYRLNLAEYFRLYGLTIEHDTELLRDENETKAFFEKQKKKAFSLSKEIKSAQQAETAELRRYYGGVWFEEYVYARLKEELSLRPDDIALSVRIFRPNSTANDNEIDVAFVWNNALYIVECKVSMHGYGKEPKETVETYLYKLAAISKDFGLIVRPYLFTLHKMEYFPAATIENIEKRMRILGIRKIVNGDALAKDKIEL